MRPHTEGTARAAAATLLVAGVLMAFTAGWASANPTPTPALAASASDTVAVGDRRCLTRRAEDCLPEPVPLDEPHNALCATCHNLWERGPAKETARSCSDAECHDNPQELSDFHGTVHAEALENCMGCHDPHDARIPGGGQDCVQCHEAGGQRVEWAGGDHLHVLSGDLPFRHGTHPDVSCTQCHQTGQGHGTVTVSAVDDCRSCHHDAPEPGGGCQGCHGPTEMAGRILMVPRQLDIHVGTLDFPTRELPFDHGLHMDMECLQCHVQGPDPLPPADGDCSSCHAEHHTPESNCYACHLPTKEGAHTVQTHMGCTGAGCHTAVPEGVARVPRTRPMCLACHTELVEHEVEKNCVDCHRLPNLPPPAH